MRVKRIVQSSRYEKRDNRDVLSVRAGDKGAGIGPGERIAEQV